MANSFIIIIFTNATIQFQKSLEWFELLSFQIFIVAPAYIGSKSIRNQNIVFGKVHCCDKNKFICQFLFKIS
jgi:hypothetical protein